MARKISAGFVITFWLLLVSAFPGAAGQMPQVLSLKEQASVYDGWLAIRLEKVLPGLMRREKIDLWLVICQE
jgi:hypothetical protein